MSSMFLLAFLRQESKAIMEETKQKMPVVSQWKSKVSPLSSSLGLGVCFLLCIPTFGVRLEDINSMVWSISRVCLNQRFLFVLTNLIIGSLIFKSGLLNSSGAPSVDLYDEFVRRSELNRKYYADAASHGVKYRRSKSDSLARRHRREKPLQRSVTSSEKTDYTPVEFQDKEVAKEYQENSLGIAQGSPKNQQAIQQQEALQDHPLQEEALQDQPLQQEALQDQPLQEDMPQKDSRSCAEHDVKPPPASEVTVSEKEAKKKVLKQKKREETCLSRRGAAGGGSLIVVEKTDTSATDEELNRRFEEFIAKVQLDILRERQESFARRFYSVPDLA